MGKRTSLYLRRNAKRSILLFLLLFVISFSLAIGVTVWNSIGAVTKEVQNRLGTSFVCKILPLDSENTEYYQMVLSRDGSMKKTYTGAVLNHELAEKVMQLDGVTAYNGELKQYVVVDNIKLYPGAAANRYQYYTSDPERKAYKAADVEWGGLVSSELNAAQTAIYSNTETALNDKFRTGAFELVSGRHITAHDRQKVLISDELAAQNDLQLGDTIQISMRNQQLGWYDLRKYDPTKVLAEWELEIVGIFHVNGYQPTGENVHEYNITYNWLMADEDTVSQIKTAWDENYYEDYIGDFSYYNLTVFVDDPSHLAEIVKQAKQLKFPDSDYCAISLDDTMYKSTVDPLHSIRNMVAGLVGAIVAGCMIVLLIVFTMWVRSRRQEVAIYLSLGFSKAKILGQFVLEAVIVAALALLVALPASIPSANAIGNQMLASTIQAAQPQAKEYTEEEIYNAAMSGKMSELFACESGSYGGPEHIDFSFGFIPLLALAGLELLLIVIAICKGGWFIFQLQPRQILTALR
ncbi:ABC transporter permease [Agathobaculum sp. Marseille-P7918]|uniref:ABC transporter permease n=1 Tax=Agathobaculum sp. Marseille-P7918 TaxID=2479843 RepID=UPI0013DD8CE9|nr:FtsX-like permease family protein [Agathobaculum sp. Marseille-P7918]